MALQNLLGDIALDGTLEKIAQSLQQISSSLGRTYPDTAGNVRVSVSSGTLGAVTTVTTVANVTSLNQMAGFGAQYDQYAQIQGGANAIRSQITVS